MGGKGGGGGVFGQHIYLHRPILFFFLDKILD